MCTSVSVLVQWFNAGQRRWRLQHAGTCTSFERCTCAVHVCCQRPSCVGRVEVRAVLGLFSSAECWSWQCLCVCGCVLDYFFEEIVVDDVFRKCSWRRVQSTRYDWTVYALFLLQTKLQRDRRRLLLFFSQYHNLYHRKLVKKECSRFSLIF